MAFDDFVIEPNLVSCLRTNEADRENSGREEYSCLQTGEGETAGEKSLPCMERAQSGFKNSCHPTLLPHHGSNSRITMQSSSSGPLHSVRGRGKKREDRWR